MSVLKIGKVRPTYKGEWNAETGYEPLDWVLYRGVAYQALLDVPVNREPDVNPDYWVQTGMKGDKGDQGEPGERGPAGTAGRDGAEGVQGPAGPQGPQGVPGPKGDPGAQGVQGAMGTAPRHQWTDSKLAFQNPDGSFAPSVDLRGPQGVRGPEGPAGPQGIPGPAGAQGPQGPQGVKGDTGASPALNNTVTSTSTVQAATANAVKTAYDKAVAAANTAAWAGVTGKPASFAPAAHKASHQTGGADALTAADVGAVPVVDGKAAYAGAADVAASLGQGGAAAKPMTFHWSSQGGQPQWLWGSNDGVNHYVYNPANFSVAHAGGGVAGVCPMPTTAAGPGQMAAAVLSYAPEHSFTYVSVPPGGTWLVMTNGTVSGVSVGEVSIVYAGTLHAGGTQLRLIEYCRNGRWEVPVMCWRLI